MPQLSRGAARAGLIARGALYAILSVLAFQVARGDGSTNADSQGALQAVAATPFGTALLGLLGIGFAAFAGWQARQTWRNDEWPARIRAAGRALLYTALAMSAVRFLTGQSGAGNQEESITARLLDTPPGSWLVGATGLVIVVVALSFLRHVPGRGYLEDFRPLPQRTRNLVSTVAVIGIGAKVVVYALVGTFLVRAAARHNPDSGVGLDGALSRVSNEPYGTLVLTVVATGLMAYALWCGVRARYEDVERSDG